MDKDAEQRAWEAVNKRYAGLPDGEAKKEVLRRYGRRRRRRSDSSLIGLGEWAGLLNADIDELFGTGRVLDDGAGYEEVMAAQEIMAGLEGK